MEINIVKTPKKYESMPDEIVRELLGLLEEILPVQERAVLRFQRLEQKRLTVNEKSAAHTEIFDKCKEEYAAVIAGRCTEKEMQWKHPGSIGTTPEYAYIKGEYTVDFTMKKADTATVITHFQERDRGHKHKFVLKLVDGKWLVDEVYSGYEDERKWYYTEL
ncbi:MAG: hypothetical protein K2G32_01665 [Oscillospiraceae bacterium]|nr:hypothetical protein [Oscillospiraceae bacterium]